MFIRVAFVIAQVICRLGVEQLPMVSEFLLELDLALELGLVKSLFILLVDFGELELFAFNELRMGKTLLVTRVTCFYKVVHV